MKVSKSVSAPPKLLAHPMSLWTDLQNVKTTQVIIFHVTSGILGTIFKKNLRVPAPNQLIKYLSKSHSSLSTVICACHSDDAFGSVHFILFDVQSTICVRLKTDLKTFNVAWLYVPNPLKVNIWKVQWIHGIWWNLGFNSAEDIS